MYLRSGADPPHAAGPVSPPHNDPYFSKGSSGRNHHEMSVPSERESLMPLSGMPLKGAFTEKKLRVTDYGRALLLCTLWMAIGESGS
jgi:hypothetical protein